MRRRQPDLLKLFQKDQERPANMADFIVDIAKRFERQQDLRQSMAPKRRWYGEPMIGRNGEVID